MWISGSPGVSPLSMEWTPGMRPRYAVRRRAARVMAASSGPESSTCRARPTGGPGLSITKSIGRAGNSGGISRSSLRITVKAETDRVENGVSTTRTKPKWSPICFSASRSSALLWPAMAMVVSSSFGSMRRRISPSTRCRMPRICSSVVPVGAVTRT